MNTQKRFWVFAGVNYYPAGGMDDFQESFDSCNEASIYCLGLIKAGTYGCDWTQIYDTHEHSSL